MENQYDVWVYGDIGVRVGRNSPRNFRKEIAKSIGQVASIAEAVTLAFRYLNQMLLEGYTRREFSCMIFDDETDLTVEIAGTIYVWGNESDLGFL